MKVTKYIPLAFVLIMAFGCEHFDDFERDASGPFRNRQLSDEVKNPFAVFSDFVIICDEYNFRSKLNSNNDYYKYNYKDGIQISSSKDFQSIVKEYSSEDLKESKNTLSVSEYGGGSISTCCYWMVDKLKPQTTYYCRFFSEDQFGGRIYKDTLNFTTNDIKFSDLIEVKELGSTFASVQAKWDDAIPINTGANTTIQYLFAVIHENDTLKITGNKQEGKNIWDADFLSLTPNTSYKLEPQLFITIDYYYYNSYNTSHYFISLGPIIPSTIPTFMTPQYKAMDFVDLGTGIKWATCNLGATQPEQTGGYYTYPSSGIHVAGTNLDVVTKALGNGYRMPTWEELQQLCDYCSWTEEEKNGVKGMRCTGTNGNSIFFPYTGIIDNMNKYYASPDYDNGYRYGSSPSEKGTRFYVLSGNRNSSYYNYYSYLKGWSGNTKIENNYYSTFAMPIRPVKQ